MACLDCLLKFVKSNFFSKIEANKIESANFEILLKLKIKVQPNYFPKYVYKQNKGILRGHTLIHVLVFYLEIYFLNFNLFRFFWDCLGILFLDENFVF